MEIGISHDEELFFVPFLSGLSSMCLIDVETQPGLLEVKMYGTRKDEKSCEKPCRKKLFEKRHTSCWCLKSEKYMEIRHLQATFMVLERQPSQI